MTLHILLIVCQVPCAKVISATSSEDFLVCFLFVMLICTENHEKLLFFPCPGLCLSTSFWKPGWRV